MQQQQKIDWRQCSPQRKAEIIAQLYDPAGTSASQLAERLHQAHGIIVSRNAVIGTYGRMPELKKNYPLNGGGGKPGRRASVRSPVLQAEIERRNLERRQAKEVERRRRDEERELKKNDPDVIATQEVITNRHKRMAEFEATECFHVELIALEPHQCKWPIGTSNYVFCGISRASSERPYCDFHNKIAFSS